MDFHRNNSLYIEILVKQLNKFFKNLDQKVLYNLIYLHIYLRANKRLPRYFYYVHKSLNSEAFSVKEKFLILKNFPFYIYFRFLRFFEKFKFLNKIIFFINNKKEIYNLRRFKIWEF